MNSSAGTAGSSIRSLTPGCGAAAGKGTSVRSASVAPRRVSPRTNALPRRPVHQPQLRECGVAAVMVIAVQPVRVGRFPF